MTAGFRFDDDELLAAADRRFLDRLIDLAELPQLRAEALRVFDRQAAYWGALHCGDPAPITIGSPVGSPFECSLVLGEQQPELRWNIELLGAERTRAAYRASAFQYLAELGTEQPRALELLELVKSLPENVFLVHGVACVSGQPLAHKVYLHGWHSPQAGRFPWAAALERLGVGAFARTLEAGLLAHETVSYVSVDLDDAPNPRVKVYLEVPAEHADDSLARWVGRARQGTPEAIQQFRTTFKRGLTRTAHVEVLCLTTRLDSAGEIEHVTYFLANLPHLLEPYTADASPPVGSDAFVQQAIHELLARHGAAPAPFDRILEGLTVEPLEQSYYFTTHVSYQERTTGAPRLTWYFAPQIYAQRMAEVIGAGRLR